MHSVGARVDPAADNAHLTLLGAVLGPAAAYVIVRNYSDVLEEWEFHAGVLEASVGSEAAGRQMRVGVAQIREAARQFRLVRLATSEHGRTEVPKLDARSNSEHPPGPGLTTRLVAEKLRLSPRQVTNLIDGEKLSATKVRGQWLVDEVSVVEELERRSS